MKVSLNTIGVSIIGLILVMVFFVNAQYTLGGGVFSSGYGDMSNSTNGMVSSLGQPLIGMTDDGTYFHQLGFWVFVNVITGLENQDNLLPKEFELLQNYPNPFNPVTKIKYAVPKTSRIRIEIYNVLGQRVKTLVDAEQAPGYYIVDFYANDLASGFYVYRLQASSGFNSVKKMIITK
jgi:hypothetical protein